MSHVADEYLSFSSTINEQVSAIMFGLDMNVENYDHKLIWDYITDGQAKIRGYDFSGTARKRYSGFVFKDEEETSVIYNRNMNQKRINFTIAHELTHLMYHLDEENHSFSDTRETLEMSSADHLVEFQANIGASAILLPEPVFITELKKGTAIAALSNAYGISEAALYNRLIHTMQGQFEASYLSATKAANRIINKYSSGGKSAMMEMGKNLEKKVVYTNPFYEALCI